MKVKTVCILDTSVASKNMGDIIIVDSIMRILEELLPDCIFVNVGTHDYLSSEAYKVIDSSCLSIVTGTNLLCGNLETYRQWKIEAKDFLLLRNVLLMGVGWWQYQDTISDYTRNFYNLSLSQKLPHSVRDQYTANMLKKACPSLQIFNTCCPTMWSLDKVKLSKIRHSSSRHAELCVTTITDYKADLKRDTEMINSIQKNYSEVFAWIQGVGDFQYLDAINQQLEKPVKLISPTLSAYDSFLISHKRLDFIGTRLHAGIRALQHGHPASVIEVDNRATEISRDTGLPTIPRNTNFNDAIQRARVDYQIDLNLPSKHISDWKQSLKSYISSQD